MTKEDLLNMKTFRELQLALTKHPELLDDEVAEHVNIVFGKRPYFDDEIHYDPDPKR